jgi:acyl carrier protein
MATQDEVRKIISRVAHCSADEVQAETALKDIKADSLHWVQIIVAAENAYNIEIDFEKVKELATVQDLVNYIDGLKTVAS